jgi:hypothetical protein
MPTRWSQAAVVCLVLVGCAAEAPPQVPQTDAEAIAYWLDLARIQEASDHQLDVLEGALERGTALRADVNEVLPDYYDCLDVAGLIYHAYEVEPVPGSGIYLPGVNVEVPDSSVEVDVLEHACGVKHEMFIASAYSNQPSSMEAEGRVWSGTAMRTCLSDRGYAVDESATAAEIHTIYDKDVIDHGQDTDYRPC